MTFFSSSFILLLLFSWTLFLLLPAKTKPLLLLAASLFFYAGQGWPGLLILLAVSTSVWFASRVYYRHPGRKSRLNLRFFGIIVPLLVLISGKYHLLLAESLLSLGCSIQNMPNWVTPLGLSFFIFKLMSLSLDQLRADRPENYSLKQVTLFAAFFPQVLSGPIDRAKNLIPQFQSVSRISGHDLSSALTRITWGLFKKVVVADRLALFINPVFNNPAEYQGLNVLLAVYFYAFQIYCDFSGYSDLAIGLARLFGIRSAENFRRPYGSSSLSEFWNRWHITLSYWLRDYLFLPLSYSIMPRGPDTTLRNLNTAYMGGIFITMLLGGLWHTASWTMIIWGGLHGFYLACGQASKKLRRKIWKKKLFSRLKPFRPVMGRLITFHLVALAWVFFKAPGWSEAMAVFANIKLELSSSGLYHLLFSASFLLLFFLLAPVFDDERSSEAFARKKIIWRIVWLSMLVIASLVFSVDQYNEFIYFRF